MKSTFFRAFGIACFLIGMILFFVDGINSPEKSNEKELENVQKKLDEANQQIKKLEAELKEKTATKATENEKSKEQPKENTTKEDEKVQNQVVKGTLYIYQGLSIYDVASKLKEMGIIENSVEMELYLAQPEYAKYLQLGQFELDSTMSTKEIADIITGKKKN